MNEGVRAEIISDNSCRQNVRDPECKFNMYDQPPGDIDLVMAIKVQLLISHAIHSHGPHTTYVCHGLSIILPIPKNDQY